MKPLLDWLHQSKDFFADLGFAGVLLYALIMVVAGLLLTPLAPFAAGAGLIFGFTKGFLAVSLGTGLGAVANFFTSRRLLRGAMERRIGHTARFRAIDEAVGREGWRIVGLMRYVPVPFGFTNYAFGLSSVGFVPYVVTTTIAIVPANLFLTWCGVAGGAGLDAATGTGRQRHWLEYVFLGVGLVAALLVLRKMTRIARAAVAEKGVYPG